MSTNQPITQEELEAGHLTDLSDLRRAVLVQWVVHMIGLCLAIVAATGLLDALIVLFMTQGAAAMMLLANFVGLCAIAAVLGFARSPQT